MGTTKRRSSLAAVVALAGVVAVPLLGQTVGSPGIQPGSAPAAAERRVTQANVERWKQELATWGRWGADDERGTLNLITPEKRKQAAALVREGISVSLARDAETGRRSTARGRIRRRGPGRHRDVLIGRPGGIPRTMATSATAGIELSDRRGPGSGTRPAGRAATTAYPDLRHRLLGARLAYRHFCNS